MFLTECFPFAAAFASRSNHGFANALDWRNALERLTERIFCRGALWHASDIASCETIQNHRPVTILKSSAAEDTHLIMLGMLVFLVCEKIERLKTSTVRGSEDVTPHIIFISYCVGNDSIAVQAPLRTLLMPTWLKRM
eukprot:64650-Amphidinium_carterae.1